MDSHPFAAGTWRDRDGKLHQSYYCCVEDRLSAIKTMDEQRLDAVLALEGVQKTVRKAAEARLKRLRKASGQ